MRDHSSQASLCRLSQAGDRHPFKSANGSLSVGCKSRARPRSGAASGGSVVATVFSASVSTGGSTPWTYWEYTFTAAGTYTVETRVANWIDSAVDSYMGLDAVMLTGLPTGLGPKNLKQDAIDKLSVHAGESKKIDKAIKEIEKSLDDQLWVDDTHIDPKHGKKVFDRERHSVNPYQALSFLACSSA